MINLLELRDKIDEIDRNIVRLFEQRMEVVEKVAQYKIHTGKQVLDTKRETEKLEKLSAMTDDPFNSTAITEVFRLMMSISRKRQYQMLVEEGSGEFGSLHRISSIDFKHARVVFQGVEGAYSFAAMREFFDESISSRHVATWREAMQLVADQEADFAVLPIENSTAGIVSDIYDLMLEFPNYIVGEQIIRIEHKLMALPGAKLEDIRHVYSHPQALEQCRRFLDAHPEFSREKVLNTAVAAKQVSESKDRTKAAIASHLAAEQFGLEILVPCGLSEAINETRFIVISNRNVYTEDANCISICFELPHKVGTLYTILSHFIFNGLSMSKIESRPIPDRPWEYRFFIDFAGNLKDSGVQNALFGIRAETKDLRILGNYRANQ